jgi:hypothetical protein
MVQRELGLNGFCGRGPDEGLGVPVGGGDVAGNRAFEVFDRAKDALRLCQVSLEKKPSTALSQEQEVGVKWNVHRGCSASQAST